MPGTYQKASFLERLFAGHHDVVTALRSLRRSPGFVAIAVLSLGLAIGLNTTTFALLDAIEHPYLPFNRPSELFTITSVSPKSAVHPDIARDMVIALRGRHDLYQAIVPWAGQSLTVEAGDHLVSGMVATVGTEMFQVLGAKPALGRTFNPAGDAADAAVISHDLWENQFGARTDLDSLTVTIQRQTYRVIGVMPSAMRYPATPTVWLPMAKDAEWSVATAALLLRTRTGDDPGRVEAQLAGLSAGIANAVGFDHKLLGYRMQPLRRPAGPIMGIQKALSGASVLILLVACLNLANLMLARGIGRRREVAVRMAVGASGAAVMRFVLTEAAVLAIAGGAWGVMLSLWGVNLAQYRMPTQLAEFGFIAPHVGWPVVLFGVLVTASTVMIAGLLPALQARRAEVNDVMKDGGASSTGRRNRSYMLLAIGQSALALMVMMGSGLLIRNAHEYAHRSLGYDSQHVLWAYVQPSDDSVCRTPAGRHFLFDLAASMKSVPGVRFASASNRAELMHFSATAEPLNLQVVFPSYVQATPDYFRAWGIRIAEGRDFVPGDNAGPGAVILSHYAARQLFGTLPAVGHMIRLGSKKSDAPWLPVVGVAAVSPDTINGYVIDVTPSITVVRRDACGAATVYARMDNQDPRTPIALYHALRAAAPAAYVGPVLSPRGSFEASVQTHVMVALLFTAFGVFGLALAAFGAYGVLSYVVSQRMREFAMRVALGANASDLRRLVFREAVIIVLAGTAIGAWGAMWGGHYLTDYLYHVPSTDVFALVGAEAILIAVVMAACLAPAWRAMRADPVDLLRAT